MTTDTHDRTDAQITRALAEALGWRVEWNGYEQIYRLKRGGQRPVDLPYARNALEAKKTAEQYFPDWLHDTDAALALCRDYAAPRQLMTCIIGQPDSVVASFMYLDGGAWRETFSVRDTSDARALALLALAVLEDGDGS